MSQINSYRLLVLLAFLFAICSILLFINIFFESVNRSLEQDINVISNEKMNLRMSFLHHSSVNNLNNTASKLKMVHIDETNSFNIDPKLSPRMETPDQDLWNKFLLNYNKTKENYLYGF